MLVSSPTSRRLISTVLLVAAAGPMAAQQQLASSTTLKGIVFDSLLSRRPLADAQVWVEGTDRFARTDARGRWQIEDVPSARHRIVAWHPQLDSAGFSSPVRLIDLTGVPSAYLTLATPSSATVYERQCPGVRPRASGVLLGSVRPTRAEKAVSAGVVVEARWLEFGIGRAAPRSAERSVRTTTDADGRYRLCGVPNDVALAVTTWHDDVSTGPLEVHLRQREVGVQTLVLGTKILTPGTGAVLSGRVLSEEGRPLAGAEVRTLGRSGRALVDPSGNFMLDDLTGGSQTLEIRAIGYGPRRFPLELGPGAREFIEVVLQRTAVALPELSVTGRAPSPLDLNGFEMRRKTGAGVYLDEAEIRRRHAFTTIDLFLGIPGVDVANAGGNGAITFKRSGGQVGKYGGGFCSPRYVVDGVPRSVGTEDPVTGEFRPIGQVLTQVGLFNADAGPGQLVRPEDLAGVEIYRGVADAPPQYAQLDSGCGLILFWTKRGRPNSYFRQQKSDALPSEPLPEKSRP